MRSLEKERGESAGSLWDVRGDDIPPAAASGATRSGTPLCVFNAFVGRPRIRMHAEGDDGMVGVWREMRRENCKARVQQAH